MIAKIVKLALAFLCFTCLAKMPYGYYELFRFAALVGFVVLAYYAIENGKKLEVIIFIALAVLFQPLIKIALGRSLWNIIDVFVGMALSLSVALSLKKKENGKTN